MSPALCAAIAIFAAMPSAICEGWVCVKALDGMSRNPEMYSKLRTTLILGCGLCETTAIYSFVISILVLFVG